MCIPCSLASVKRTIVAFVALCAVAPVAAGQMPRPPVPEPQVRIASDRAAVRADRAAVILRCSGGEAIRGFVVTVTLRAKVGGTTREIGRRRDAFCEASGRTTVKVPLNPLGRRTLHTRGNRMTARARAKLRSGDVASRRITLHSAFINP